MSGYYVQRQGQRGFTVQREGGTIVLPFRTKLLAMRCVREMNRRQVTPDEVIVAEPPRRNTPPILTVEDLTSWKAQGE